MIIARGNRATRSILQERRYHWSETVDFIVKRIGLLDKNKTAAVMLAKELGYEIFDIMFGS